RRLNRLRQTPEDRQTPGCRTNNGVILAKRASGCDRSRDPAQPLRMRLNQKLPGLVRLGSNESKARAIASGCVDAIYAPAHTTSKAVLKARKACNRYCSPQKYFWSRSHVDGYSCGRNMSCTWMRTPSATDGTSSRSSSTTSLPGATT